MNYEEEKESFDVMCNGELHKCVNCGDRFEDGDGGKVFFDAETFCVHCKNEETVGAYFRNRIPKNGLCKLLDIINTGEEL